MIRFTTNNCRAHSKSTQGITRPEGNSRSGFDLSRENCLHKKTLKNYINLKLHGSKIKDSFEEKMRK